MNTSASILTPHAPAVLLLTLGTIPIMSAENGEKGTFNISRALSQAASYPQNDCGVALRWHSSQALIDRLDERGDDLFGHEIRIEFQDVLKQG